MGDSHWGPTAPIDLTGVSTKEVTLTPAQTVTLQAVLLTNPSALVHWRVANDSGLAATALATAEGCLSHLGTVELKISPAGPQYLYLYVTDIAGTTLIAGALDRVCRWVTA